MAKVQIHPRAANRQAISYLYDKSVVRTGPAYVSIQQRAELVAMQQCTTSWKNKFVMNTQLSKSSHSMNKGAF